MGDGRSCLVLLLSLRLQGLKGAGLGRIISRRWSSPNHVLVTMIHTSPLRAMLLSIQPMALGSGSFEGK